MSSAPLNLPGDLGRDQFSPPVVTLTPEQSASKLVELRDAAGNSRGLLLHDSGMTILYTSERLAELRRRAASQDRGRTLREVIDAATKRAAELSKQPQE